MKGCNTWRKGEKHSKVMLTFLWRGVETSAEPHIRKMAGCLQTKLCPHAVTNKVAISLKETAVGSLEEDYCVPHRCLALRRLRNYGRKGAAFHHRQCRLEQNAEAAGCAGSRGMKAASK